MLRHTIFGDNSYRNQSIFILSNRLLLTIFIQWTSPISIAHKVLLTLLHSPKVSCYILVASSKIQSFIFLLPSYPQNPIDANDARVNCHLASWAP